MPRITVHRKDKQLSGKKLSANTLASLLVAQDVRSVPDLSPNRAMSHDLMLFLNRERAIGYWIQNGWLQQAGDALYLTESGIDEVENREAGEALNAKGKKKPVNVTPALIAEARRFILSGETEEEVEVLTQSFQVD